MSSLIAYLQQIAATSTILFDDVVALAKPALARIGDTATAAKMAAASTSDDILPLTKLAMRKAGAVVVDDTAVSSDQLNEGGIAQHREYAVWRKIVACSLLNKAIIQTVIMVTGAVAPVIPQILLAFGAGYLAFEGAHKMMEYGPHLSARFRALLKMPSVASTHQETQKCETGSSVPSRFKLPLFIDRFLGQDAKERAVLIDLILLDAILSTEILLVANGSLGEVGLLMQTITLGIAGIGITLGVYGVVLCIVRADNVAGYFANPVSRFTFPQLAHGIMAVLPNVLKVVGVIGTVAMLGVAGDVVAHLLPAAIESIGLVSIAHTIHGAIQSIPQALSFLPFGAQTLGSMIMGFVCGLVLILSGRGNTKMFKFLSTHIAGNRCTDIHRNEN